MRLRGEAAALMDALVTAKVALAEAEGRAVQVRRALVRAEGAASASEARLAAVKAHLLAAGGGLGLEPDVASLFVVGSRGSE